MTAPTQAREVTRDAFLGGKVTVIQPAAGYRAGLDAVLLGAAIEAGAGERIAEAGTGAGTALLCAAHRLAGVRFIGFERDAAMAELVREGAKLNGLGERVSIETVDIASRAKDIENAFDQSFANPPFFEPGAVRAPAPGRAAAYLADAPLKAWVLFLLHVAKPGGRVTLVHRAAALADLLELLNPRAGEIEVMPVRPAPGGLAHRILVRARKGLRRGPVRLYDGITLHASAGGPSTPEAAAILAGGALDWR